MLSSSIDDMGSMYPISPGIFAPHHFLSTATLKSAALVSCRCVSFSVFASWTLPWITGVVLLPRKFPSASTKKGRAQWYIKKVRCWIKSYRYSYFSYTSSIKFSVVVYYEQQAVLVVFRLDSLPREVWRFEWQMRVLAFPCRNHAIW